MKSRKTVSGMLVLVIFMSFSAQAAQKKSITFPGVSYTDPRMIGGLNNSEGVDLTNAFQSTNDAAKLILKMPCKKDTFEFLVYFSDGSDATRSRINAVRALLKKNGYSIKTAIDTTNNIQYVSKDKSGKAYYTQAQYVETDLSASTVISSCRVK